MISAQFYESNYLEENSVVVYSQKSHKENRAKLFLFY